MRSPCVLQVANGVFERLLTGGTRLPTESELIACSLGAGATSAVVYGPVDMVMIHQQKLGLGPMATVAHLARQLSSTYLDCTALRGMYAHTVPARRALHTRPVECAGPRWACTCTQSRLGMYSPGGAAALLSSTYLDCTAL